MELIGGLTEEHPGELIGVVATTERALTLESAGSAILFGEFGHRYLNLGDVGLIPPTRSA